MTIQLLAQYGRAPVGAVITLDAATEAALISAGQATSTLTGGIAWTDPYGAGRTGLAPMQMDRASGVFYVDGQPGSSLLADQKSNWVGFGDSIMINNGGPNVGGGLNFYDKGWATWASAQLGGRLNCVRNAGVSGDNTAMMLARLETDVTPYASQAKFCFFNGGVNDPKGGNGSPLTFAQSRANLAAIIARLTQLFPVTVWLSPTPYAPDATTAAQVAQIAAWVRATAPLTRGVLFCDAYAVTVDKTAITGSMVAGFSSDNPMLHPNAVGARAIGAELAAVLTPHLSASPAQIVSQHNSVANAGAAYATQACPNPLLVNNGGTITGTNVTSVGAGGLQGAPSGYTVRAGTSGSYSDGTTAVTAQLAARADGYGNDLVLTQTAGANAGTPLIEVLTADQSANVSSGQVLQGLFTLSMVGVSNLKKIILYVTVTDGSGSTTLTALTNDGAATTQADISNFVFKTKPYTVIGTCTALRLRVDITGVDKTAAGVFRLGRLGITLA